MQEAFGTVYLVTLIIEFLLCVNNSSRELLLINIECRNENLEVYNRS